MSESNDIKAKNKKTLIALVAVALGFYVAYIVFSLMGG
jgi:hypothetical protein